MIRRARIIEAAQGIGVSFGFILLLTFIAALGD